MRPPSDVLSTLGFVLLIFESVVQSKFAFPLQYRRLLSYHDSRLLAEAVFVFEDILFTLNIPLPSLETIFRLSEFKPILIPIPDKTVSALVWEPKSPSLPRSVILMQSSPLSLSQIERALGSCRYRICFETIPTEVGHSSCLATLFPQFSQLSVEALSVCDTKIINIPTIELANYLGFGI